MRHAAVVDDQVGNGQLWILLRVPFAVAAARGGRGRIGRVGGRRAGREGGGGVWEVFKRVGDFFYFNIKRAAAAAG